MNQNFGGGKVIVWAPFTQTLKHLIVLFLLEIF